MLYKNQHGEEVEVSDAEATRAQASGMTPVSSPTTPPVVATPAPAVVPATPTPTTSPTATPTPAVVPSQPVSTYQGSSVTDYLSSLGKPSDFASRTELAKTMGIPNYTGTAAQNTQLLTQMRGSSNNNALAAKLPITPPTTVKADTIANNPTSLAGFTEDNGSADLGKTLNLGMSTIDQALMGFFNKQQTLAEEKKALLQTKQDELLNGFTELSSSSSQKEMDNLFETYKVQQKMDALTSIKEQINKKTQALNLGLQQENDRIAPMSIIGRREQKLRDQASGELSALAVTAQVLQEDVNFARELAELSFTALQADKTKQLNAYSTLLQMNKAELVQLNEEEKDAIDKQITVIKESQKEMEKNKDEVFKLIADNPIAASKAGVSLTESRDTAYAKMLPFITKQAEEEQNISKQKDLLDIQYKKAQIQDIYSTINKRVSDAKSTQGVVDMSQFNIPGLPVDAKNQLITTALLQNKSIGQGTRTATANALNVVKSLQDLASANPDSKFTGVNPLSSILNIQIPWTNIGLPFRNSLKKEKTIQTETFVNAINLKVQQWASGASLTKQQIDQVDKFTPRMTDTDANFKTKVNSLANFMYSQISGNLQSEGVNFKPDNVNLFEMGDLMKQATPEQKEQLKQLGLIK